MCNFHLVAKWWLKCSQLWWKKSKKIMSSLASYITCISSFDLWMPRTRYNIFAIIVSFINTSWISTHMTIDIFKVHNIIGASHGNQVNTLDSFGLLDKVIAYIKDEGFNLSTLTSTLIFVVSCYFFQLTYPFVRSCFDHDVSKVAWYVINHIKISTEFQVQSWKKFNICCKKSSFGLKSRKGRHEWKEYCIIASLFAKMLRTPMKT